MMRKTSGEQTKKLLRMIIGKKWDVEWWVYGAVMVIAG